MSPTALNWTIFALSFVVFGIWLAAWLRRRNGGGHDGERARPHRAGSPGGHPRSTPPVRTPDVEPVSGVPLDMTTALPWFHRGTVYFFATEASRARFVARTSAPASARHLEGCR
jgi:YHS domain-containing protein